MASDKRQLSVSVLTASYDWLLFVLLRMGYGCGVSWYGLAKSVTLARCLSLCMIAARLWLNRWRSVYQALRFSQTAHNGAG
jgi:hypothetical protein